MFFNIGLDTGKSNLIRAVIEGVCFHLRWMLEAQEKKVKTSESDPLRRGRRSFGSDLPDSCRCITAKD
jgi:glycerol kinase